MWKLYDDNREYGLACNKDIVVGRKDTDIIIANDTSVSRKHALLKISHQSENLGNPCSFPVVTLTDLSKFGTFLTRPGQQKVKVIGASSLMDGDIVQFGAQRSIFKLCYKPLVITTSMLKDDTKTKMQETIVRLGGHMVNNWHNRVTHVVVDEIKLSIKVTQALAHCCHIVTPQYILKLGEVSGVAWPEVNPESYLPKLAEPNLSSSDCSFKINRNRKKVFAGKTFVHMCKRQMKRLGTTITYGGGKSLMVDDPLVGDDLIAHQDTCMLYSNPVQSSQIINSSQYEHIQQVMIQKQLRFIQEHEIGLAVLYCDASVYCNAVFDLNSQNAFTENQAKVTEMPESVQDVGPDTSRNELPSKKRQRKETHGQLQDKTELAEITEDHLAPKKSRITGKLVDAEKCIESNSALETSVGSCSAAEPSAENSMPDSCLDDDNLWSQNFESSSHVDRQEASHDLPVKQSLASQAVKNPLADQPIMKNVKVEKESPQKQFPRYSSKSKPTLAVETEENTTQLSRETKNCSEVQLASKTPEVKSECPASNRFYNPAYPVNVSTVKIVSLVVRKNKNQSVETYKDRSGIKNFKTFRKVWPTYTASRGVQSGSIASHPGVTKCRIIGGSDFFVHKDRMNIKTNIENWFGDDSHRQSHGDPFGRY